MAAWATCSDIELRYNDGWKVLTFRPTDSDPMKVMCLMKGDWVMASASSGQHATSYVDVTEWIDHHGINLTWTMSGSCPHTLRHSLAAPMNHVVDQTTFSEHLTTIAFPAKIAVRIGESALWRAEKL